MLTCVCLWRVPWPPQSINHLSNEVIARDSSLMSRCSILLKVYLEDLFEALDPRYDLLECTFTMTVPINAAATAIATSVVYSTMYVLLLPRASAQINVAFIYML
jgi:hypothetical protein